MPHSPIFNMLILLAIAGMSILAGTAFANDYACMSPAEPLKIDGKMADWSKIPINFFEDDEIGVALASDASDFYLLLRFPDREWARQIRLSGLNIWIDQQGGKKKEFGLRYNGGPSEEELQKSPPEDFDRQVENLSEEKNQRMKDRPGLRPVQLDILDEKSGQVIPIKSQGVGDPAAGFVFEEGFYCYEIKVPLKIVNADFYGIDLPASKKIGIGLEWGGMPEREELGGPPGGGSMGGPPAGGGGEGLGGPPPGGPRGGDRGGPGFKMPERKKIWFKMTLFKPELERKK